MTGEQLRDELIRIAEAVPHVDVPADTFVRGRRATTRSRVLSMAAAAACMVAVAAVAAPVLLGAEKPPVAGTRSGAAVPDHIYFPDDGELHLPVSELSDVGPAVAVYGPSGASDEFVVISQEGDYLRIKLPGFDDSGGERVPLLSPDGTVLAYPLEDRLSSHLVLVDLRSGDSTHVSIGDDLGAVVRSAQWSPDGDWLAWSGQPVVRRTSNARGFGAAVGGVVRVATAQNRALPRARATGWDGLGVCDDGVAVRYDYPKLLATGFDGDVEGALTWRRLVGDHGSCSAPAAYAQLDIDEQLLGWIPDSGEALAVFLSTQSSDGAGERFNDLRVVQHYGPSSGPAAPVPTPVTIKIGDVAAGISHLSIATGLMTAGRPTAPAGPDPWADAWVVQHWVQLAMVAMVIAAAGIALLLNARVRRSPGP